MYVGITGTIGSGKGEAALILRRFGFRHYSFADVVREHAAAANLPPTLANLRRIGTELRAAHGNAFIAKELVKRCQVELPKHAVFESIHTLAELQELRRLQRFILLSIDAPRELRFERVHARGARIGVTSFEEFAAEEDALLEGEGNSSHILDIMDAADIKVVNIGNLEELEAVLREELRV